MRRIIKQSIKNKKGQAAMEFLMTYGWAILAAIIAIGVLAYFGVFSLRPSSIATVNAPWYVNAWNIQETTSEVSLEFRNNGGETLEIRNVSITGSTPACTSSGYVDNISASDLKTVTITCTGLNEGDAFRGNIAITYRKPGSTLDLTSSGSITGTVVP